MATKHIEIQLSPEAKAFLIDKGFDETNGARPLRRAIEKHVQDPLAEEVLTGRLGTAQSVAVRFAGDKLVFVPADKPARKIKAKDQKSKISPVPSVV